MDDRIADRTGKMLDRQPIIYGGLPDITRDISQRLGFSLDEKTDVDAPSTAQTKPRLDGRQLKCRPPTRQFNTRISEMLYERLYRFCETNKITMTEVVAQAVEELISKSPNVNDAN